VCAAFGSAHRLAVLGVFSFNDTSPAEIYTLSLHDALPIWHGWAWSRAGHVRRGERRNGVYHTVLLQREVLGLRPADPQGPLKEQDRKSTRLNSSHRPIPYAGFCLQTKKKSCTSTCCQNRRC